jgi:sensor c-di-GMP phosphodiesterase-like protein
VNGAFQGERAGSELAYQPIVSLIPERPPVLALHSRSGQRYAGWRPGGANPAIRVREWLDTIMSKAAALYIEMPAKDLVKEGLEMFFGPAGAPKTHRERLIVEIDSAGAFPDQGLAGALDELRRAGIRISVATECSDASYQLLLETHPDYLRISDYVVRDCAKDTNRQAVLEAISHLSWKMGSSVIADGVRSKEDLVTLKSLGIDYAEGGHLCAPLPFDEAIRWTEDVYTRSTGKRRERSGEGP